MKTLFLECGMGAAGDMLAGALLEVCCSVLPGFTEEGFLKQFAAAGIPDVTLETERSVKCGITGTHVRVLVRGEEETAEDVHEHPHHDHRDHHEHSHAHRSLHDIEELIGSLSLPADIRDDITGVYRLIAEAESAAHERPLSEVHFHEVGGMDAVADIAAVTMLMHALRPCRVVVSPVASGFGAVRCAHGILPVPAPATAFLLKGIPSYAGRIEGELCTPTGAALLKYFADSFGQMPVLSISGIGYGMGRKDFERANCVRAFLGEPQDETQTVFELSCNVDDMTGEEIGFATEKLFDAGALDVYTVPVYMKKNRPGVLLRVLCEEEKRRDLVRAVFRFTSTIGIRESEMNRYVLRRQIEEVQTEQGILRRKAVSGYGVERAKWEYEDLAAAADREGISLREAAPPAMPR